MNQLNTLLSERRNRKSISEIQSHKVNSSHQKFNPLYQKLLQTQALKYQIGQPKKNIIKINHKKLPVDFFVKQKQDEQFKSASKNDKKNQYNATISERKINSEKLIENQKKHNFKLELNEIKIQEHANSTNLLKNRDNNSKKKLRSIQQNTPIKQKFQRNYKTRSEQKRDKNKVQDRKFTAINSSQKQDILEILPIYKQKFNNDINNLIIFTGQFAKQLKQLSGKISPSKQFLTSIKQSKNQSSPQNRQKYKNLKLDVMQRITLQNSLNSGSHFLKSKEINFSSKKQKQPIPMKIIPNMNIQSQKKFLLNKNNEILKNLSSPSYDAMNITFFNAKSTNLPLLVQHQQSKRS